ncbi:WD40 repeat domain-containing protein [Corallococcus exiguus]|uniref:WD40 repeat domain-containing protein n=1 Tax=Corallococcus exiguus TaxID=83462 RepID=UPI0020164139|nr:WD40 repeat domain-containing protein [Corallococcus exiguus]
MKTPGAVSSLCWSGDALVDPVGGVVRYHLDGTTFDPHVRYSYRFDRAVMSPDGRYSVLYESLGTTGLLLDGTEVVRQLTRDFYHANTHDYPVALHTLPSGRTLLAHCPESYCVVELEDAATGERLTKRDNTPTDIFHSRLQFSPDGRYLASAGWIWHPVDAASVFDVPRALEEPASLDSAALMDGVENGIFLTSVAFGVKDTLVFVRVDESRDGDTFSLGTYSLRERKVLSEVELEEPAGPLMVVDAEHIVDFFGHPKLVARSTGRVVQRWEDLDTGKVLASIRHHLPPPPHFALDAANRRFAVGTADGIEVITLAAQ